MAPWQFSDDIHAAVLLAGRGGGGREAREPRGCAGWVGREVGAAVHMEGVSSVDVWWGIA